MDFDKCKGCPIYGQYEPYEPRHNGDEQYVVIVDRIYQAGIKADRAIPPATQKMFLKHMENEGFHRDQFTYHPYTLCAFDENELSNKEQEDVRKHCRAHMLDLISELGPDAILSTGADATKQALGKNVKITQVRGLGQTVADFDQLVMPVLHPGQALRYPETEPFLASDAASFGRLVDADYSAEKAGRAEAGEMRVITDLQELIDQQPETLAFDMETTGLSWLALVFGYLLALDRIRYLVQ